MEAEENPMQICISETHGVLSLDQEIQSEIILIHDQKERKKCDICNIEEDEIWHSVKTLLIEFEETNQYYCEQCLKELLLSEQNEMRKIEENFIYQKEYETSLSDTEVEGLKANEKDETVHILEREVAELAHKEQEIDEKLKAAKTECDELLEKVFLLEQREERFWNDMCKLEKRALKLEEKTFLAQNQGDQEKKVFENLCKTTIIDIVFKIEIEDNHALIQDLPIGKKLEQAEINWEETNSGLGHLLLAFNYLILRYGIVYSNIDEVKIKGHLSEIKLKQSKEFIPVGYGVNTGSTIGAERKFGIVMDSLLLEMSNIAQHIQEIESLEFSEELKLPYKIDQKEAKIIDCYVNPAKLEEKNKWAHWTKAMRYFLINFKHMLAIASLTDSSL